MDPISAGLGIFGTLMNFITGQQAAQAGREAAAQYDQTQGDLNEQFMQMMGFGGDAMAQLQGSLGEFANPELRDQLMAQMQSAVPGLEAALQGGADQLGGLDFQSALSGLTGAQQSFDPMAVIGSQRFTAPTFDQYGFDAGRDIAGQSAELAAGMGDRARTTAREQMMAGNASALSGLDAALASRGLSRGSGAAASAIGDLARSNVTAMSQLERGLADQAGQQALQASQFDIQSGLQRDQMGSQYNLGMNNLMQEAALGGFQANLGALSEAGRLAQGYDQAANQYDLQSAGLGLQAGQMDLERILQQAQLGARAQTDPLALMQQTYSTNFLDPFMQTQGQFANLASLLTQIGATGMDAGQARLWEGVGAAGTGAGAAQGGAFGFLGDILGLGGGPNMLAPILELLGLGGGGNTTNPGNGGGGPNTTSISTE